MKFLKVFLVSSFVVLGLAQAPAHAFRVNANVRVNPGMVIAEVCNNSYDDGQWMQCHAQANGLLNNGTPLYAWTNLTLRPGQCQNAYVYVNMPGLWFIRGDGFANCNWYYPGRPF